MDELFWDNAACGYFSTPEDQKHLILRLKEEYDGAEPSPARYFFFIEGSFFVAFIWYDESSENVHAYR